MALKLHPDKNRAPQAEGAFKKVSKAYACLTDKDKKRIYDQTGKDPTDGPQASPSSRRGGGRTYYEEEINPEDIFNAFFGGNVFG